jgi:ATP/maltotriose-dependent transcriptional regulator MalT
MGDWLSMAVIWITLAVADNDIERFLAYLITDK